MFQSSRRLLLPCPQISCCAPERSSSPVRAAVSRSLTHSLLCVSRSDDSVSPQVCLTSTAVLWWCFQRRLRVNSQRSSAQRRCLTSYTTVCACTSKTRSAFTPSKRVESENTSLEESASCSFPGAGSCCRAP